MAGPDLRARGDRGAAIVEFALCLPFLALVAFAVADVARGYALRNRLAGAAREGAAVAQFLPTNFDSTCGVGTRTIEGNAAIQDAPLAAMSSFKVTEQRKQPDGTLGAVVTTCPTGADRPVSGDRVIITVSADLPLLTPIAKSVLGSQSITISPSSEVVVQ